MIYVTDLNDNTEPLNHLQRAEKVKEVNGALSLMFTSFFHANNPGHSLIAEESIVSVDGYDFRIKKIREEAFKKEVVALSTYFDLVGHWQHDIYGGTRTLDQFLAFVFDGTGWTYTVDLQKEMYIPNFGENNVIALVDELTKAFDCKYQILPNKTIHFAREIGPDNDAQFRFGHNIKTLSISVDSTSLRTKITGIRPPSEAVKDDEGNVEIPHHDGFRVTYTSPYAEKYGTKNREAEPIINDEVQSEEEMIEILKAELNDYPETSIELDIEELTNKELGERVWLIYEQIKMSDGSFMEFQTRILKKTSVWRNGRFVTESVVVGNTQTKSITDIIVDAEIEISKNKKWTRSRIEQTNSRITLAVEQFAGEMLDAYALIELTATEIRTEVADLAEDTNSKFSQTAERITMEVNALNQEIDGVVIDMESKFSVTAESIRASVRESKSYTDNEVGEVRSYAEAEFNVTAEAITSSVRTSKSYTDDKVGNVQSNMSTQFNQLSGRINAKAEATTVTDLGRRVGTVEWSLDAVNEEISQTVKTSDYNGETMISRINQTSSSVKIQAKNITLQGAVTVLSELSNDLGNIYAGNIDISNDIRVGRNITMQGNSGSLRLPGNSFYLESLSNGDAEIHAYNDLTYTALEHTFNGRVDFSRARDVYGVATSDTNGLGFAFNGNDRVYVRINGRDVGHITLEKERTKNEN